MAANSQYISNTRNDETKSRGKFDWILGIILIAALFLYGWATWKAGSANAFYTAAIKSMTMSFHNFWYGSFDPAGYITVDKPPVALWFMAISAKIFGLHGWSIVLPSVLFGVGSVYLMYRIIQPYFGKNAGRLSALALTITPIVVADSRTNNMDATLVFFLMLGLFFLEKSIGSRRIWPLLVSFGLIGIAFNVKMLQAFMILPAMYLFYWLAANESWKKKITKLIFATVSLLVFTLAYPISVDMTPASRRPYVGGSETNSLLELAFGYNGSERLLGQTTGTGGTFGAGMNSKTQNKKGGMPTGGKAPTGMKQGTKKGAAGGKQMQAPGGSKKGGPGKMGAGGGGGGAFNIGTIGPFRLFQSALGPQVSWLLPFALFGLIGGLAYFRDKRRRWFYLTTKQKQLILWTSWLIPVYGFFSIASFFHPYYMIMLAPPIAALFGTGLTALIGLFKNSLRTNWKFYLLPLAITATAALQSWYVYSYYPWLTWIILIAAIAFSIGLIVIPRGRALQALLVGGLLSIMAAPTWWSLTPTIAAESAMIPTAGPSLLESSSSGMPGGGGGMGNSSVNKKLLSYLEKHQGNAKYLFATSDSTTAAPYIIKTGKAVMAMGGFNGTDPAITLTQFKKLVKNGELKYFYYSGKSGNTAIINWIKKHATKVKSSLYQSSSSTASASGMGQKPTASTGKQKPSGNGAKPTPGMQKPSGKGAKLTPGKQNSKMKSGTKSSTKSTKKQTTMQLPGGMGGMGASGVLYDLSSIYK
ncbi:Dolichyl-phosphate-mannose-protein mannosyltransferase [Lentilactobacillus parabuchneri]|uniref:glycosyltransferase family 39 protein n=1 Tax=Lentilactobacillus parabuchneri TaxID=152331 RepID=UPI000A11AA78|nr:glycosyltransferase family 39 protein [Lentilactobacillus parabuchneri]ORN29546.1 Dolichyl-phosphate-mannose-protein mannosyltransferase [Lentilactobacillus parabuchneri]